MKRLALILLCCSAAPAAILLNSFNSGRFSKDLKYRADLEQHAMASETLTNILIRPQGMAYKRPGTEYIDTKRTSIVTAAIPGEYPTLRTTTDQADPGLTHTTAVSDATDLQNMNNNKAGNYYLTADIDASGIANFLPIGTAISPFTGTFDGCGYTITGLTIDRPTTTYIGLFGDARGAAQIANVTLADCAITGKSFVGALAGAIDTLNTDEPLVQNCHTSGTLTTPAGAVGLTYWGGLIGYLQGRKASSTSAYVYDCSSSCDIDGTATTGTLGYFGGLIGISEQAVVSNCFATGAVNMGTDPQATRAGGFIGQLDELTRITYCYATGDVSACLYVGGFQGFSGAAADEDGFSYMQKCYATGDVTADGTGANFAGGFTGVNSVDITDCYAWGDVTLGEATGSVGGFTGIYNVPSSPDYNQAYCIGVVSGGDNQGGFIATSQTGTFAECYWDTDTSGQATSDEGVGKTTVWLKDKTNFPVAWDFDTIWYNPQAAGSTVDAGNAIRLIPFEYSTEDAYVMEFGHTYIGFFRTTQ